MRDETKLDQVKLLIGVAEQILQQADKIAKEAQIEFYHLGHSFGGPYDFIPVQWDEDVKWYSSSAYC